MASSYSVYINAWIQNSFGIANIKLRLSGNCKIILMRSLIFCSYFFFIIMWIMTRKLSGIGDLNCSLASQTQKERKNNTMTRREKWLFIAVAVLHHHVGTGSLITNNNNKDGDTTFIIFIRKEKKKKKQGQDATQHDDKLDAAIKWIYKKWNKSWFSYLGK